MEMLKDAADRTELHQDPPQTCSRVCLVPAQVIKAVLKDADDKTERFPNPLWHCSSGCSVLSR